MATKAGKTPPPKAPETAYRTSLQKYLAASWKRITRDPNADISDLYDLIAIKSLDTMLEKVNVYNLRKVLIGLERIGSLQQSKALGADIASVLSQARIANVNLITNLTEQQRGFVIAELAKVDDEAPLAGRLAAKLGFSKNRAKVIARDQVSKINAALSEQRHKAAGSTRYAWSTSNDERVRDEHAELDGQEFDYDDPNGGDKGQKPGEPVLCRCIGVALFD